MKQRSATLAFITLISISALMATLLSGCAPQGPATPEEMSRAREVLNETSPRNMDGHPKAVQNVRYRFDSEPGCPTALPCPTD